MSDAGPKIDSSIKVGDIDNATGVAIGHGAQVKITQSNGATADEIAAAFVKIMQAVDALPEGPKKQDAYEATAKLEVETRKGDQAEKGSVQGWLTFLADASADAWDVAVASLSNPALGLGTAFKKIVQRAKEEREQRGT